MSAPVRCALVSLLALSNACGDDDSGVAVDAGAPDSEVETDAGPPPFAPESFCPGSEGCEDVGDDVLYVGAAQRDITPVITETTDIMTLDVNGNGVWDPADGDEIEDRNGNGDFDPIFIGGFGNPRPASGVHDPQWVRAIALRQNETTIVLLMTDTFSIFIDDTDAIREQLAGDDVDYVATCASHTHQGTDTLGIYGLGETISGVDPAYLDRIHTEGAAAAREAIAALQPAHIQYATFRFRDQPGGMSRYVSDARHPRIIDDEVRILRFTEADSGDTIATWVNLAAHPEYWGSRNTELSSDFPHYLREGIENGIAGPDGELKPGVGGMAAFCAGALGSQIGPGEITPETWAGEPLERHGFETMQTVGEQMAYFVLDALDEDGGSETDETADLGFRNRRLFLDVQNAGFHIAILNDLFVRQAYDWDPEQVLSPSNQPDVETEVAIIDIGRMQILWMPGEIDPALFVGGYDGGYTPEDTVIVDTEVENAPVLAMAPPAPYLRDLAREDADWVALVSLGNDQIGYLLPEFNFVLDRRQPYIEQAAGEHYEETNSVGKDAWPRLQQETEALLAWRP